MVDYIADNLFDAVSVLINKKIETVKFDTTVEATIIDASGADKGEYVVTEDGINSYVAYSTESKYRNNDAVLVTIPQGNYENQKIIVGKKVGSLNTPMIYVSPFSTIVDVSKNLIDTPILKEMYANYKNYRWELSEADFELACGRDAEPMVPIWDSAESPLMQHMNLSGYSRIGLQAQFASYLGEYNTIKGNYGIALEVTFQCVDLVENNAFKKYIAFDSSEFFGDVYNFDTFYTQDNVYDIGDYIQFPITRMRLFMYQRNNFYDNTGARVPAPDDEDFSSIAPNIVIKDPYICVGVPADGFDTDTAQLTTTNSLTYYKAENISAAADVAEQNGKSFGELWTAIWNQLTTAQRNRVFSSTNSDYLLSTLNYTYSHLTRSTITSHLFYEYIKATSILDPDTDTTGFYSALNNTELTNNVRSLITKQTILAGNLEVLHERENANTKEIELVWIHRESSKDVHVVEQTQFPKNYEVRWYRYSLGAPSPDLFAGAHWKRFYGLRAVPNESEDYCITDEEISNQSAEDTATNSLIVKFIPNVNLATEKLKVVIIQNESFDENNEAQIQRYITQSNVIEFVNQTDVRSDATVIDLNTLSIRYEDEERGKYFLYNRADKVSKNEANEIRVLTAVFDPDEPDVYKKALLRDYTSIKWTFPSSNTMIKPATTASLDAEPTDQLVFTDVTQVGYFIKSTLNRNATNNTVLLEVWRDGQVYNAEVQMLFGTAGTSGSDYTLVLTWDNQNEAVLDVTDPNTAQLLGTVGLYNQAGEEVLHSATNYTVEYDWLVSESTAGIGTYELVPESRDLYYPIFKAAKDVTFQKNGSYNPFVQTAAYRVDSNSYGGYYHYLDTNYTQTAQDISKMLFNSTTNVSWNSSSNWSLTKVASGTNSYNNLKNYTGSVAIFDLNNTMENEGPSFVPLNQYILKKQITSSSTGDKSTQIKNILDSNQLYRKRNSTSNFGDVYPIEKNDAFYQKFYEKFFPNTNLYQYLLEHNVGLTVKSNNIIKYATPVIIYLYENGNYTEFNLNISFIERTSSAADWYNTIIVNKNNFYKYLNGAYVSIGNDIYQIIFDLIYGYNSPAQIALDYLSSNNTQWNNNFVTPSNLGELQFWATYSATDKKFTYIFKSGYNAKTVYTGTLKTKKVNNENDITTQDVIIYDVFIINSSGNKAQAPNSSGVTTNTYEFKKPQIEFLQLDLNSNVYEQSKQSSWNAIGNKPTNAFDETLTIGNRNADFYNELFKIIFSNNSSYNNLTIDGTTYSSKQAFLNYFISTALNNSINLIRPSASNVSNDIMTYYSNDNGATYESLITWFSGATDPLPLYIKYTQLVSAFNSSSSGYKFYSNITGNQYVELNRSNNDDKNFFFNTLYCYLVSARSSNMLAAMFEDASKANNYGYGVSNKETIYDLIQLGSETNGVLTFTDILTELQSYGLGTYAVTTDTVKVDYKNYYIKSDNIYTLVSVGASDNPASLGYYEEKYSYSAEKTLYNALSNVNNYRGLNTLTTDAQKSQVYYSIYKFLTNTQIPFNSESATYWREKLRNLYCIEENGTIVPRTNSLILNSKSSVLENVGFPYVVKYNDNYLYINDYFGNYQDINANLGTVFGYLTRANNALPKYFIQNNSTGELNAEFSNLFEDILELKFVKTAASASFDNNIKNYVLDDILSVTTIDEKETSYNLFDVANRLSLLQNPVVNSALPESDTNFANQLFYYVINDTPVTYKNAVNYLGETFTSMYNNGTPINSTFDAFNAIYTTLAAATCYSMSAQSGSDFFIQLYSVLFNDVDSIYDISEQYSLFNNRLMYLKEILDYDSVDVVDAPIPRIISNGTAITVTGISSNVTILPTANKILKYKYTDNQYYDLELEDTNNTFISFTTNYLNQAYNIVELKEFARASFEFNISVPISDDPQDGYDVITDIFDTDKTFIDLFNEENVYLYDSGTNTYESLGDAIDLILQNIIGFNNDSINQNIGFENNKNRFLRNILWVRCFNEFESVPTRLTNRGQYSSTKLLGLPVVVNDTYNALSDIISGYTDSDLATYLLNNFSSLDTGTAYGILEDNTSASPQYGLMFKYMIAPGAVNLADEKFNTLMNSYSNFWNYYTFYYPENNNSYQIFAGLDNNNWYELGTGEDSSFDEASAVAALESANTLLHENNRQITKNLIGTILEGDIYSGFLSAMGYTDKTIDYKEEKAKELIFSNLQTRYNNIVNDSQYKIVKSYSITPQSNEETTFYDNVYDLLVQVTKGNANSLDKLNLYLGTMQIADLVTFNHPENTVQAYSEIIDNGQKKLYNIYSQLNTIDTQPKVITILNNLFIPTEAIDFYTLSAFDGVSDIYTIFSDYLVDKLTSANIQNELDTLFASVANYKNILLGSSSNPNLSTAYNTLLTPSGDQNYAIIVGNEVKTLRECFNIVENGIFTFSNLQQGYNIAINPSNTFLSDSTQVETNTIIQEAKAFSYFNTNKQKAFINVDGNYIVDPYDWWQEGETYYEPIQRAVTQQNAPPLRYQSIANDGASLPRVRIYPSRNWTSGQLMDSLSILQVTLKDFGDYDLVAYFPIPLKNDTARDSSGQITFEARYIEGPTSVRYTTGGTTEYNKNPYELYAYQYVPGSGIVRYKPDGTWSLLIPTEQTTSYTNFLPKLSETDETVAETDWYKVPILQPIAVYIPEAAAYGVQFRVSGSADPVWSQPILVYEDHYPSTTLNKWNGKDIVTDGDTGTILASAMSAGKKERDNTFTGVMLGDWSRTDTDSFITKQTGLYGFNHGAMAYAFKDDGTGFIGRDGRGRIWFNGNDSTIYSSNWKGNEPLGMFLDIDDGIIKLQGKNNITYSSIDTLDSINISRSITVLGETQTARIRSSYVDYNSDTFPTGNQNRYITLSSKENIYPLAIGTQKIESQRPFKVRWDGRTFISDGVFSGLIHAKDGWFDGDFIVDGTMYGGTFLGGTVYTNELRANKGYIADWTITPSGLINTSKTTYLFGTPTSEWDTSILTNRIGIARNPSSIASGGSQGLSMKIGVGKAGNGIDDAATIVAYEKLIIGSWRGSEGGSTAIPVAIRANEGPVILEGYYSYYNGVNTSASGAARIQLGGDTLANKDRIYIQAKQLEVKTSSPSDQYGIYARFA